MRGRTLAEKQNGPGFRDRLLGHVIRIFKRCAVEGCQQRTYAVLTLYVDAHPPGWGWYERLIRSIPVGNDTEVGLCKSHSAEVIARDLEWMDSPELWEPGRENPPVMPGPGRLV
jgi:hypothetical protein